MRWNASCVQLSRSRQRTLADPCGSPWATQVEPTTTQIVMLVLNYTACIPVIIAVGVFSLFHIWSVLTNTTTIESWEKDRAVSLKRRGKIREVRVILQYSRRLI